MDLAIADIRHVQKVILNFFPPQNKYFHKEIVQLWVLNVSV